jgi:hypothetical protein
MKMSIQNNKKIAIQLDRIATISVSNALIPVVTKKGILIGSYLVILDNGMYAVKKKDYEYFRTYTKSAAMILAGMMSKNYKNIDISSVIDADRVAHAMRNDIDIFKHHYEIAVKNDDDCKKQIMATRFELANEKYIEAKRTLRKLYSKLF